MAAGEPQLEEGPEIGLGLRYLARRRFLKFLLRFSVNVCVAPPGSRSTTAQTALVESTAGMALVTRLASPHVATASSAPTSPQLNAPCMRLIA